VDPVRQLSIRLLGPFQSELEGQPLTDFRSDKVRALLAYLVVEIQRPHTRTHLADLLWPNHPEATAQSNFRNALWNLRHLISDQGAASPFILVTQATVQFNPNSALWLDVKAFRDKITQSDPHLDPPSIQKDINNLEAALDLYQGSFMSGFSLDSPTFETWMVKTRECLRQQWVKVLSGLCLIHKENGNPELALGYAKKWIEEEPWEESAYRSSMEILLALGHRHAALAQFTICQQRLAEDLGVEPEPETVSLYERIKHSSTEHSPLSPFTPVKPQKPPPIDPGPLPRWLQDLAEAYFEPSLFVARQKELAQLGAWLDQAMLGHGRTAFITGEPGSGKTTLLAAFVNQALTQNPHTLVLWGHCNAFTGGGDPYFPFMNMTRIMAGDVEPLLPASVISLAHLQSIWRHLPKTLTTLVEQGPDLIKRFIPLTNQFALANTHPGVHPQLLEAINTLLHKPVLPRMRQPVLNDQFVRVVSALSKAHPLILVIDDLQWIDPGSASLLFHLSRQMEGKRILLLGAFRPEEVLHGVTEKTHPLEGILQELQTNTGTILINLSESEGQDFVNAILDSEPNNFSTGFYNMLYQHTSGHPLFTIELLRGMQLRNEIRKNQAGRWIEGARLNWIKLPTRVEAVIARRITLMPVECQALMTAACVQGDVFNVEALACMMQKPENEVFDLLNQQVCRRHRLITPQGVVQVGDHHASNFRFRHALFQIYLYNQLNQVESVHLHKLAGYALEKLYKNNLDQFPEIAHTLARHFELAHILDKAEHYYTLAGKNALHLNAHQEAIEHFYHALDLLEASPPSPSRDLAELELQISLGAPLTSLKGWGAPQLEIAYNRAQVLCENIDDTTKLIPFLWLLAAFRIGRSEHTEADQLVARLFKLAQQTKDPALLTLAYLQVSPFYQGKFKEARLLLERAAALQDVNQQRYLAHRFGFAPAPIALTYLSNCLWLMGFPKQSDQVNVKAFEIAKTIGHPMTICYVTSRACWIGVLKEDLDLVQAHAEQLYLASDKYGFKNFAYAAVFFMNWVKLKHQADVDQAIEAMNNVIESYYATKTVLNRTAFLVYFAQVCLATGKYRRGLETIIESIDLGEKTGELWFQAEALRTKGELLLMRSENGKAEKQAAQTCFETALQIAQDQGAKTFELRAAISLARLWQNQDRGSEALQVLDEVYSWFTEGFHTADLQEAQRLLESLQQVQASKV